MSEPFPGTFDTNSMVASPNKHHPPAPEPARGLGFGSKPGAGKPRDPAGPSGSDDP